MNQFLREIVNVLSNPVIYFTASIVGWWALMKYPHVWTRPKFIRSILIFSVVALLFALTDENFRKEALKPDNVPIWIMSYGVGFFAWLAFYRGHQNDLLMAEGKPNLEKQESDKRVYSWPDLVYSELICM